MIKQLFFVPLLFSVFLSGMLSSRVADYPIHNILLDRWSPRAMSGELVTKEELMPLFEAARWAQSAFNNQPWRFIYVQRDSRYWDATLNLLMILNRQWCKNAGALVIVLAKKTFTNGMPSRTASFDVGAACQNIGIQGTLNGLVIHAVGGSDYGVARELFHIPDEYSIEIVLAVGKPGKKEDLPPYLQEREVMSGRRPIQEFVFENEFAFI